MKAAATGALALACLGAAALGWSQGSSLAESAGFGELYPLSGGALAILALTGCERLLDLLAKLRR
jgi:hypothetical protein